jgi:zinc transporter ZupT
MNSSDLLEFFGVAFVVTLIVAACAFLFSSYNHFYLSRMGAILVKIAAVMLGIMILIWLSELAPKVRKIREWRLSRRAKFCLSLAFGSACGLGVFLYFYPAIASFTWLTWFFAAVLIVSFAALQPKTS